MPAGDELRSLYLDYFQEQGHLLVPSSSLVPAGDPTLLLTTAGMVQFKPYFLGQAAPPRSRMTSAQKCFRATDIDTIGDHKHLTFFEMMGNFSVGDYFKRDAIGFGWDFLTQRLKLSPERLMVTVYADDDDAAALWGEVAGLPPERIYRYAKADNWWGPPGAEGPCGPCSEIFYDFGAELGCDALVSPATVDAWVGSGGHEKDQPGCHPNCDRCERFVELWNLVFMQFYQDTAGELSPLPAPNIDTGLGLERAAVITQGARNIFETDLFRPIIDAVCRAADAEYGGDAKTDRAIRVVAEHARGAVFLIGDGVLPGNDSRGYVLRRLIRRAVRFGRKLGLTEPFLGGVSEAVIDRMRAAYPDLESNRDFILRVLRREEEQFGRVLEQGLHSIETMLADRKGVDESGVLGGDVAFTLWDTYGMPVEETEEIVREHGLSLDLAGFEREMEAQRERARAGARFTGPESAKIFRYRDLGAGPVRFVGYERLVEPTVVAALLAPDGESLERAEAGRDVEVVLQATPFYAEGGGQVGDGGEIVGPAGRVVVVDTQAPIEGLIVHGGRVAEGSMAVGDTVEARVDRSRRIASARNHSATHLAHAALRRVLGPHVRQAGSLVAPDRLRFDFTHNQALTPEELRAVERLVNEQVLSDATVTKRETPYTDALAEGALAFFGDKYGATVRVVEMGDDDGPFTKEVCGGTHLDRTGEVGLFLITSESAVGSGMRRLEAVTGFAAGDLARGGIDALESLARGLETTPSDLAGRVAALQEQLDRERRRAEGLEREAARHEAAGLLSTAQQADGVTVLTAIVSAEGVDTVREMGDYLRDRLGSGLVVLGSIQKDRPMLVAMLTADLVAKGLSAVEIVREAAKVIGGGGGGRPEVAQAGGTRTDKLAEALALVPTLVRQSAGSAP